MIDLYSIVFTELKNNLKCEVLPSYPKVQKKFPCIVFEQINNSTVYEDIDTSGEFNSRIGFEINVFSKNDKKSQCRKLADEINVIMTNLGIYRLSYDVVPNYEDDSIYRIVLRYDCIVSKYGKIYRG